jgi:hypothetical protein
LAVNPTDVRITDTPGGSVAGRSSHAMMDGMMRGMWIWSLVGVPLIVLLVLVIVRLLR